MTIEACCSMCGVVKLEADDVTLVVCSNASLSYYAFHCPDCHDEVRRAASDETVSKLLKAGVQATTVEIPAEVLEPHDGPTITSDDWLDLAVALHYSADIAGIALAELAAS